MLLIYIETMIILFSFFRLYPVDKNRIDSLSMDENPVEISKEKKKFK